jgi:hypothetical protein
MDKKLLLAFSNLSLALEHLSQTLDKNSNSKKSDGSTVADALKKLDISDQIKSMDIGIKKIQDTQKQTITAQKKILDVVNKMASQKSKESDTKKVLRTPGDVKASKDEQESKSIFNRSADPKNKKPILDGLKVVLLIAAGVLAIGLAFKIIGKVDWKSVIALAIAMPFLAFSFEKVSKSKIGDLKEFGKTLIALGMFSVAIAISSRILEYTVPIGVAKLFTIVLISTAFAAISLSIGKLAESTKNIDVKSLWKLPLVLLATSAAIAFSSWVLQLTKPVGFAQLVTIILIAAAFSVISFGLGKIVKSLKGIDPGVAASMMILMPLMFLGISIAIAYSSKFLAQTTPISFAQSLTVIMISAMFVVLSYGLPKLADAMSKLNMKGVVMLPLVLVALSVGITASSKILSMAIPIKIGNLFSLTLLSIALTVMTIALSVAFWAMDKLGMTIEKVIMGGLSILVIATTIMLSSKILSMGDYGNYPSLSWTIDVSLSMLAFGVGVIALGLIMDTGIGAEALVVGALGILMIAATITATADILGMGSYDTYPDIGWSLGVGASLLGFGMGAITLGLVLSSGIGFLALLAGIGGLALVAGSIVATSMIISSGTYTGGPSLDWAIGTALLMTTYGAGMMLLGAMIMGTLGLGLIGLEAASGGIDIIAKSIVSSASILSGGKFTGGPSKEWAEGVSLAISAFAPVYSSLGGIDLSFITGSKAGKMADAIRTISQGIVDAALFFNDNKVAFSGGFPSYEWSSGVGDAIGAFAPVFDIISKKSSGIFGSSGASLEDLQNAITGICQSIVAAAQFFNDSSVVFTGNYPSAEWASGVGDAISAFSPVFEMISGKSGGLWGLIAGNGPSVEDIQNAIVMISRSIADASLELARGNYNTLIPDGYMDNVNSSILSYMSLIDQLRGKDLDDFSLPFLSRVSEITRMADDYDRLAESITKLSSSINSIELEKIQALKLLSGSVVLMSLMDSGQFESMMDALEDKAKVFSKVINDLESGGDASGLDVSVKTGGSTAQNSTQQLLDVMNSMNAKLATISANSSSISSYINHLKADNGKKTSFK